MKGIKEAGKLEAMAKDLNGNKTSYSVSDEKKVFDIFDSQKRNIASIDIGRGFNGIWKIAFL